MVELINRPMFKNLGYLPGEKEVRTRGQQFLNLLSAVDPAQGIMRGMSASGRAFDSDLSPEERKSAAIEAALETAVPAGMLGIGALAKQPAKAALMDMLTVTGAPSSVAREPGVDRIAPVLQDLELIRAVDRPDIVKDIFRDDEYAADVLGDLRNAGLDVSDAAPKADVQKVREELYRRTQDKFANLPDEITVYRAGDLNETDGISSFTLNPNYSPDLDLPWNKLRGSPKLEAYTVKKSDILVSPDLIRDFGEGEVIIRNSSVVSAADKTVPRYANGGQVTFGGLGSMGREVL